MMRRTMKQPKNHTTVEMTPPTIAATEHAKMRIMRSFTMSRFQLFNSIQRAAHGGYSRSKRVFRIWKTAHCAEHGSARGSLHSSKDPRCAKHDIETVSPSEMNTFFVGREERVDDLKQFRHRRESIKSRSRICPSVFIGLNPWLNVFVFIFAVQYSPRSFELSVGWAYTCDWSSLTRRTSPGAIGFDRIAAVMVACPGRSLGLVKHVSKS